jgi:hypothetical protein
MKRLLIVCLLSAGALFSFAQTVDTRRKIEVTGSAETEITPDIIYVAISLKEYYNGNKKVADISELEKTLLDAVIKSGIGKENLFVNNISSYNHVLEKKKNPNFAASKQFRIKLSDPSKFNQVLSALDPKAIEYTNIEGYDHSKMSELRKELKIKALQAAMAKATYLAEAVNDKVGDALEIQELNNDEAPIRPVYANTMYRSNAADAAESAPADIDFKKIKLNYQMRVVFELKK